MSNPCLGFVVSAFRRTFQMGSMLVWVIVALKSSSVCQSQQLTPSEQLILHRLAEGGEADLSDAAFGTRKISTGLINKLLSGGLKSLDPAGNMSLYGIVIKNAVFDDQVNIHFEVPYSVQFKKCKFNGGIDFSGSQFDKGLDFDTVVFGLSPEDIALAPADYDAEVGVEFSNATVNGTLSFENIFFYAPVDFTKAHVKELDIAGATYGWDRTDDPDIDLTATKVDSDLTLSVAKEQRQPRKVHAQFLNVGGSASLGGDKSGFFATHDFDLTYSHFQNLAIYGLHHWLNRAHDGSASLDGFSFQEISFPDLDPKENVNESCQGEGPNPSTLLCLLDSPKSQYSTAPYLQLQQNLTASGHAGRANNTYIHMRNRQRGQRLAQPVNRLAAFIAWLADWFLYIVIGYGRWPWLAGVWAAVFTAVGMGVYKNNRMQPQSQAQSDKENSSQNVDDTKEPKYSAFWYSLDVLAPAVELGVDKAWEPKPDPKFRWISTYTYFHRIAGWILAPLVAAALSGFFHL
jgi:hypothetical protein